MRSFSYERVPTPAAAAKAAAAATKGGLRPHHYLAGGTTLLDLMKLDVMRPQAIIDINPLDANSYGRIEISQHGLRLGALVRMGEAADHPEIQAQYRSSPSR